MAPAMDPCGTSLETGQDVEMDDPTLTHWVRLFRNAWSQNKRLPDMP